MWIIGCDFHSGFQQVAIFDKQSGEIAEKKLLHPAEAREFYRSLRGEVWVYEGRAATTRPCTKTRLNFRTGDS